MSILLNPYFNFQGQAREALEFYQSIFGGSLEINTYGDMPGVAGAHPDTDPDWVMHGFLHGANDVNLMAADAPPAMGAPASTTAISLSGDDEVTLRGHWDGLADGAEVTLPLSQAPWGDTFGMLNDKFGVPWMVNILGQQNGGEQG